MKFSGPHHRAAVRSEITDRGEHSMCLACINGDDRNCQPAGLNFRNACCCVCNEVSGQDEREQFSAGGVIKSPVPMTVGEHCCDVSAVFPESLRLEFLRQLAAYKFVPGSVHVAIRCEEPAPHIIRKAAHLHPGAHTLLLEIKGEVRRG